jgi:hypothetical protein
LSDSGRRDTPSKGLPPVKTFFALLAVVGIVTGLALQADNRKPPVVPRATRAAPDTNQALSATQAREAFRRLNTLRRRAYVRRDIRIIPLIVSSESPLRDVATREIKQLLRDDVLFRPKTSHETVDVMVNTADRIVIRHRFIEQVRFFSESGRDISSSRAPVRQTIRWILRRDGTDWRIYDARVVRAQTIKPKGS